LRLIDLTIKMFTEPVLQLDVVVLEEHLGRVKATKEIVLGAYDKNDLMSNLRFAASLRELGVEPPMKKSPTTGKQTYAFSKTDEEFKALLEHEEIDVQALVAARLGTKSTIEETRTERFIGIAHRGALPVPLRYYAAHTGRWGGDDKVNLQNLPRISTLKYAIIPPEGYVILDSDSSQIEARTLACAAKWKIASGRTSFSTASTSSANACASFNPLAWMVSRRMREDREEACDACALDVRPESNREYALTLAKEGASVVVNDLGGARELLFHSVTGA
jgi:hypothetical protein